MTRFAETEMRRRFERGQLDYKGHSIQAKRDYANYVAYDQGFYLRDAFVVVKDGVNVIPGAGWFKTVDQAKEGIDVLLAVGQDNFHEAYRRIREAKAAAVESVLSSLGPSAPDEEAIGPRP